MPRDLILPDTGLPAVPAEVVQEEVAAARSYAEASRAPGTLRLYRSDVEAFGRWCAARGIDSLPATPAAVATWIASEAARGILPSALARRVAAIAWAHRGAGETPPQKRDDAAPLLDVMAGIRRSRTTPVRKARAAEGDLLMQMLAALPPTSLRAVRDRAILAIGMAGAFRRSELVALDFEDLTRRAEGVVIRIRKSKTDQEAQGESIAIPNGRGIRPVEILDEWLSQAGIEDGPIFRPFSRGGSILPKAMCDQDVARIVARTAAAAGLPPERWSGHSLRAGFITSAANAGATIFRIQRVSRHKSVQVLSGYVREAEAFKDHAGGGFL